jgi:hypothetical protein
MAARRTVSIDMTRDTTDSDGITDRADERAALANPRAARCDVDIFVKDNDAR